MNFQIEQMVAGDWDQVSRIYLDGIRTGNATFEEKLPSWDFWLSKHILDCNIVARRENEILGWAALSPTSNRKVYSGVVEVSVYVNDEHRGKKIGMNLIQELIKLSEKKGFWTLQAGIFPENKISINLHKKCGFRIVGMREKIGKLDGIWRDVVLMERRSKIVGTD
ncbi:GNAT family N-acetyltransferase [Methanobacterium alcaliphilum]|uniref:GNAT family N-acetyltransferase n=1 Tax=Methanobacterium alcaliphilum TaxID=392018 RepID=UPI00200A1C60|nr:GNAT family N-acetyltransferase [Methanobacterium alcaliphilum]MCK9150999.1 N-acetyltransferase family protein [Methanobacterium alcaliphilum]